ncbi:MAG: hypothetical protein BroJett040_22490 [Oligoflexia bacterium]|nr:MAG: hypothetical protein BroJett040_22490 [Oligoflexia bacterium]
MTDPFEEFEFKPITDGLGFHNKNKALNESTQSTEALPGALDELFEKRASLEMLSENQSPELLPEITPALPRKQPQGYTSEVTPASQKVDEILKTLNGRKKLDFTESKRTAQTTEAVKPALMKTVTAFSAALLDGMLVTAAYLSCLIVLLLVTKVDLFANIASPDDQGMVYVALAGLLGALSWIYLTATRIFLGHTPGEWVFDQTLGEPNTVGSAEYSLKVAVRSAIVVATGFILFPLLSKIFRRDLLGAMLGIELFKKA